MGEWHRENPELVGTDADPWMANPLHRRIVLGLDDVDRNRLADERDDSGAEDEPG